MKAAAAWYRCVKLCDASVRLRQLFPVCCSLATRAPSYPCCCIVLPPRLRRRRLTSAAFGGYFTALARRLSGLGLHGSTRAAPRSTRPPRSSCWWSAFRSALRVCISWRIHPEFRRSSPVALNPPPLNSREGGRRFALTSSPFNCRRGGPPTQWPCSLWTPSSHWLPVHPGLATQQANQTAAATQLTSCTCSACVIACPLKR